ncbi:hypothetical protein Hdeb2414_s0024g00650261 [Helianthus debilis subsp. tardiflorus]
MHLNGSVLISRLLTVEKLESFFQKFPYFPNAFLVGVLRIFLSSNLPISSGLELRMTTSTRLKTCLYSFTSPGGPMYTTRAVRHAAWDALDFLFPVSKFRCIEI